MPDDPQRARFDALFQAHWSDVAAYAARRLPPADAADLAADVFTVAWRRLADVPPEPAARLWLFGTARRLLANQRRATARRGRLLVALEAAFEVATPPVEPLGVAAALAALRSDDREVLRLAAWEGLGPTELAAVLGCSPGAAAVRLHRARRRFTAALDGGVRTGTGRTRGEREGPNR